MSPVRNKLKHNRSRDVRGSSKRPGPRRLGIRNFSGKGFGGNFGRSGKSELSGKFLITFWGNQSAFQGNILIYTGDINFCDVIYMVQVYLQIFFT